MLQAIRAVRQRRLPLIVGILIEVLVTDVTSIGGPSPFATVTNVQTVIVGAGASGMAAGAKLLENGIEDFVILEAESYYGGRIDTVRLGSNYVDAGAEWVHGEEGNVVFRLANQHQLIEKDIFNSVFLGTSANILNKNTTDQLSEIYDEIIDSISEKSHNINEESLGEYFNKQYSKKLKEFSIPVSFLTEEFLDWFEKDTNIDDGADSWFATSTRGYREYKQSDGYQQWGFKSGGFITILDLLMKKIPDPKSDLQLESKIYRLKEVIKIILGNKVTVICKQGQTYIADNVIVTVSLGVLKENLIRFEPALPEKKINSIEGLGYGTVDKIFIEFPYKWWPDSYTEFNLLWNAGDECKTQILNNPDEVVFDKCWYHFVHSFNTVRNQPQVLCGWIYGPAARYMEYRYESDYEVGRELVRILQEFVGNAFNVTVPSPKNVFRSLWYSNPHFRGSYSFRSIVSEARKAHASHLAEPVLKDNGKLGILFAGEATHESHYSTVHGAIESGWREAERILNELKKK